MELQSLSHTMDCSQKTEKVKWILTVSQNIWLSQRNEFFHQLTSLAMRGGIERGGNLRTAKDGAGRTQSAPKQWTWGGQDGMSEQ